MTASFLEQMLRIYTSLGMLSRARRSVPHVVIENV
jgi:hypothetical protein